MARWCVAGLLICLLGSRAARSSEPVPGVLDVGDALRHAQLAAEVTVLEVRFATWRGFGHNGRVRVRVTSDPRAIFRGHEHLGRTLDLAPFPLGPQSSTATLVRHVGDDHTPLFLVADSRGAILLAGARQETGYRVRTWSDYGEIRLRVPAELGRAVDDGKRVDVTRRALDRRFGAKRRAFWGRVVRFLSGEKPDADAAELDRWIAELSAAEHGRRRRAGLWLRRHAPLRIPELRRALDAAPDPEGRRNLRELLTDLRPFAEAHDLARELAATPTATRAAIVREGLPALDGYPRACADAYLRSLSGAVPGPTPPARR